MVDSGCNSVHSLPTQGCAWETIDGFWQWKNCFFIPDCRISLWPKILTEDRENHKFIQESLKNTRGNGGNNRGNWCKTTGEKTANVKSYRETRIPALHNLGDSPASRKPRSQLYKAGYEHRKNSQLQVDLRNTRPAYRLQGLSYYSVAIEMPKTTPSIIVVKVLKANKETTLASHWKKITSIHKLLLSCNKADIYHNIRPTTFLLFLSSQTFQRVLNY